MRPFRLITPSRLYRTRRNCGGNRRLVPSLISREKKIEEEKEEKEEEKKKRVSRIGLDWERKGVYSRRRRCHLHTAKFRPLTRTSSADAASGGTAGPTRELLPSLLLHPFRVIDPSAVLALSTLTYLSK